MPVKEKLVYMNPEGLGVPEVIKLERRGHFVWRGFISASIWSKLFLAGRNRRIWATKVSPKAIEIGRNRLATRPYFGNPEPQAPESFLEGYRALPDNFSP